MIQSMWTLEFDDENIFNWREWSTSWKYYSKAIERLDDPNLALTPQVWPLQSELVIPSEITIASNSNHSWSLSWLNGVEEYELSNWNGITSLKLPIFYLSLKNFSFWSLVDEVEDMQTPWLN